MRSIAFLAVTAALLFAASGQRSFAQPVRSVASPTPSSSPSPTPRPSPSPSPLQQIGGTSTVVGRGTNLVGTATAASQGTIDQEQIANRPVLRPGEVLEQIPGLIISQHSGEGKANQYYLRGFQLDHGTDLAATIAGIPVEHADARARSGILGYQLADAGTGELRDVQERAVLRRRGRLFDGRLVRPELPQYDRSDVLGRAAATSVTTASFWRTPRRLGPGNLLYAFELYHDNGTLVRPDEYKKADGVLRWSKTSDNASFAVTAQGYRGDFNSSDQIPQRLVDAGAISRFGYVDPTDGGRTYRYALSTEYEHDDPHGVTRLSAYGESYGLDLFSNFTYYQFDANDYYNETANPITCNALYSTCRPGPQHVSTYTSYCPGNVTPTGAATTPGSVTPNPFGYSCGDQREQEDKRFVSGFDLTRSITAGKAATTFGLGVRNDNITTLGLFLTHDQVRLPDGTLSDDRVLERDEYLWVESQYRVSDKLRLTAGLRGDAYTFKIADVQPANSGTTAAEPGQPEVHRKLRGLGRIRSSTSTSATAFTATTAVGRRRRSIRRRMPPIDPTGAPVQRFSPLVRAWGEELGYRYSVPKLTTTVTFWKLNLASELVFDGDQGVTTPSGPTVRKGIELTNYYRPTRTLTLDADIATATARFTTNPQHLGTYVPESLNVVTSAGITLDKPHYAASLRYRYFGPRVLDQLGDAVSSPTNVVNLQLALKGQHGTDSRSTCSTCSTRPATTSSTTTALGCRRTRRTRRTWPTPR